MDSKKEKELFDKYGKYLRYKADYYSKRGLDYDDVYNQGCLILLEACQEIFKISHEEITKKINSGLCNYYNREKKERNISYGFNADDFVERYFRKPEFAGTEYINGILSIRLQSKRNS